LSEEQLRWLWHAIDRGTGQVLAYTFGRRQDEVFLQLKELLEPFGIRRYCTDGWELINDIYRKYMKWVNERLKKLRKTLKIEDKS